MENVSNNQTFSINNARFRNIYQTLNNESIKVPMIKASNFNNSFNFMNSLFQNITTSI